MNFFHLWLYFPPLSTGGVEWLIRLALPSVIFQVFDISFTLLLPKRGFGSPESWPQVDVEWYWGEGCCLQQAQQS